MSATYPAQISDLAPEILILIFRSCPTFSTASALSKTSHQLHEIWIANNESITTNILPSVIHCAKEACQLEAFSIPRCEPDVEAASQLEEYSISGFEPHKHQATINRIQRILASDKTIQLALELFASGKSPRASYLQNLPTPTLHPRAVFTDEDGHEFLRAFYRISILGALMSRNQCPSLHERCAQWSMLEIEQALLVSGWAALHTCFRDYTLHWCREIWGGEVYVWQSLLQEMGGREVEIKQLLKGELCWRVYSNGSLRRTKCDVLEFFRIQDFHRECSDGGAMLLKEVLGQIGDQEVLLRSTWVVPVTMDDEDEDDKWLGYESF